MREEEALSRSGRRRGGGGAGVPVKGEMSDIESSSSVTFLEVKERCGIIGGRPFPSLSLGTRLILLDELVLDLKSLYSTSQDVHQRMTVSPEGLCIEWVNVVIVGHQGPKHSYEQPRHHILFIVRI